MGPNIPNLEGLPDPSSLPAPSRQSSYEDHEDQGGRPTVVPHGRQTPRQHERHLANLEDSQRQLQKPTSDLPNAAFNRSSIMTAEDMEEVTRQANRPRQPPGGSQEARQEQRPPMRQEYPEQPPVPVNQLRSLRDLFLTGKVRKTVVIAGFKLTCETLNTDQYARAWAAASVFPDGPSRNTAVMQYLLAHSIVDINDTLMETLCTRPELVDVVSRKAHVLSQLDNNLLVEFFNQGYTAVNDDSRKMVDDLQEKGKVHQAANFSQGTPR